MKEVILLILFLFTACTVGPDFKRPGLPKFTKYSSQEDPEKTVDANGDSQSVVRTSTIPLNWWQLFHQKKLDPIVQKVLQGNQTLKVALANLEQSQNNLRAGYGVFYPQVSAGVSGAHQKSNPAALGGQFPSKIFDILTLSGTVSYALDIFGGQRREVEGLRAQVDYKHYLVFASYLTLTGNALNTIVAKAAYEDQIEATKEILAKMREQIVITKSLVKAGTLTYSALLSIQGQYSAIEATVPALEQKVSQANNLLAVLSGKAPAEWEGVERIKLSELTLPKNLPVTLPSDLVRQRPDILASEAELHIASAEIGVATAALYPSFNLTGTFGVTKNSISGLVGTKNDFWNIGGGITAPIFEGGSLRAKRDGAKNAYEAALANYRQTTLNAFAQVADTLRAIEADALILKSQTDALNSSKAALELLQVSYKSGLSTYLEVLTADIQYQQIKLNHIQGIGQRLQDSIALFTALGGGWIQNTKVVDKK